MHEGAAPLARGSGVWSLRGVAGHARYIERAEKLLGLLRSREEWTFVEREVELRLHR